jgi:ABC-type sugar transport system ATPase subunit
MSSSLRDSGDFCGLVAMRGIWKSFDGNPVLKGVNFELLAGEVHALVGENGATSVARGFSNR